MLGVSTTGNATLIA
jgi:hypothetical protein